MLIYVDDIIITGFDMRSIQEIITHLQSQFAIKDLGSLHCFLGIKAVRDANGLFLSKIIYIIDLLHKAKTEGSKPQPLLSLVLRSSRGMVVLNLLVPLSISASLALCNTKHSHI